MEIIKVEIIIVELFIGGVVELLRWYKQFTNQRIIATVWQESSITR